MILEKKMVASALCLTLVLIAFMPGTIDVSADRVSYASGTGSGGMTQDEIAVLDGIDVDNAWSELEYLSSLGEKLGGTSEELSAQQYIFDSFVNVGLDEVVIESFPTSCWDHHGTTLNVISPEMEEIPTTAYGGCYSVWGTQDGEPYYFGNSDDGKSLTAQVVDVGRGTLAELDAIGDLGGAVALVLRDDNVIPYPSITIEEIALHGASAAIFYGYYNQYPASEGIKQDGVGGSLPALSISRDSAQLIQDLMQHDPVVVQIDGSADLLSAENAQSANVIGYLNGSVHPDEYIVFSAHIDTWWSGTNDDCSGVAAVLELARLFSESRDDGTFMNERTLVFCSFGAEEYGGPSDWYSWTVGSYEFVCAHPEIAEGLVLNLNADMIGFEKTNGPYWLENTWEINDFVKEALTDSKVDATWCNPVYPYSDAWSFAAIAGGSTVQASWVEGIDAYYHTQLDDLTQSSPESIKDILEFYVLMAIRSDVTLVLPIDFMPTVNWMSTCVKSQAPSVPSEEELFDRVEVALEDLRDDVMAINSYADDLRAAYDAAQTEEERAVIVAEAEDLNDALIDARRIINSWSIGQGGSMGSWDVFLRPAQHVHDYVSLSDAITDLSAGSTNNAIASLRGIYTMGWAPVCSLETYELVMSWMINDEMYWADDFDQQQAYLDVYWIYLGLVDETLANSEAQLILEDMRDDLLIPWLQEDLLTLEWAWAAAGSALSAVLV